MRGDYTGSIHRLMEADTPGPIKIGTIDMFAHSYWALVDIRSMRFVTVGRVSMSGKNWFSETERRASKRNANIIAKAEARAAKAGERKAAAAAYHAQRKARQAALWRSNFLMYVYKGNRDDGRVLTISHPLLPDPTVATHEELLASGWVLAQCKAVEVRDPQP